MRQTHRLSPQHTLAIQILACHAWQLAERGEAAYIIHRAEVGRPSTFLRCVQTSMRGHGVAYWHRPWGRNQHSNVLIVYTTGEEQAA